MKLIAYRRHLRPCRFAKKGQSYTLCDCPVWGYGKVPGRAKTFRGSLHTSDWNEAVRRLNAIEVGEMASNSESLSITEAVDRYLADCVNRNVRPSTIADYTRTLRTLPEMRLVHTQPAYISCWRTTRKVSPGTARKELNHVRFFFRWCVDQKLIDENPASRIKLPRVDPSVTMPFSQEEVDALLVACNKIASGNSSQTPYIRARARCYILLLLHSGLRRSDAAVLRRSALDADGRLTLRIEKTRVRLSVKLPPLVASELRGLPSENAEYFFWSGNSKPATARGNLWRTIKRLGAIAGIHAAPHRFRDTFACRLLENGADIRTVQKLLGHTSVRTTEKHYAPWIESHQRLLDDAASTLNFVEGKSPVVLRRASSG